ncbi:B12-binding domain-containing radical SAM protein [Streptomyces acidiscabies]|uniref:Radical SAM protein n=1 Tax=Streptomyces acidiscabies TaxID=42234 RepID=A0AAP6EHX6_9ACTN|nr:radical SAM protein [Streptomyces acidiscabies]MBP5942036.1 B12-binding domain-containing radical SAM protein [Streptomyces sp. LBUM 1476]MBZ3913512.1 B12-binding domain-containing radical SAM protein [Streptomyces acidiscabies]MDX2963349.1 radical SAM protein [Streptomyces acidiscabies]MDX3023083.1 radical SAM protein [Streptomyces acidiscabies]MDX3792773.1 radical SAM protein [Streptomyces acidiscabies]
MADAVLMTPREILTGFSSVNNQNVLINDEEYLRLDPAMRLFYEKVRENLGVACIAGHLRSCGYSVRALNLHGRNPSDEVITDLIRRERPKFVGISIMYDLHIVDAVRLLRCVREADPSVFVAIGGAFCTYNAKLIAERIPEADCVAFGEGELTVEGLMECLAAGRDWHGVPGLWFWQEGRVRSSGPPKLPDLTQEPWPARDLLVHHRKNGIPTPVASTYTSRGCHAKCTFCYVPRAPGVTAGNAWRVRSPVDVVDEIEYLQREFGTRFLWFNDDNFGGAFQEGYHHAVGFAEEILRRGLDISFHSEFRVDTGLVDREALNTLRRAGMASALLGMETGAPTMAKRFRKGTMVEYNFDAARLFKKEGIELEPGWIMVEPGTTLDELWENLKFIVAADIAVSENPFSFISRAIALRGTEMYDKIADPTPPELPGVEGPARDVLLEARREYRIPDARVEDVWAAWSTVSAEVANRKEELPFVAQMIVDATRARRARGEQGLRPLLSRLRGWADGLPDLLVAFLNVGLLLADENPPRLAERLEAELRTLVDAYDRRVLGETYQVFVEETKRLCGEQVMAG